MTSYNWTRDELILALDLYFREPSARGSKTHPAVRELSDLLNSLPIHPRGERETYFRNPSGVGMKLSNFARFDPDYEGAGLTRGARLDGQIWNEFSPDTQRLRTTAQSIADLAGTEEAVEDLNDDDFAEADEGSILTRLHRIRERSRKLVARKKKLVLDQTGRLACEACGFDFKSRYGERGEGFAECHHVVPLANLGRRRRTRLEDLSIVCANCHRMIHHSRPWLTVAEVTVLLRG